MSVENHPNIGSPEVDNHCALGLKRGDRAYIVFGPNDRVVHEVIIRNRCSASEGHGYNAKRAGDFGKPESIHTCNGYLTSDLGKARSYAYGLLTRQKDVIVSKISGLERELDWLFPALDKGANGIQVVRLKRGKK